MWVLVKDVFFGSHGSRTLIRLFKIIPFSFSILGYIFLPNVVFLPTFEALRIIVVVGILHLAILN